jgi:hypothetical protein
MGQFKEGESRPENAGRKSGTPNKRTQAIKDYCEKKGVNPAYFCVDVLAGDAEAVGKDSITFEDRQWAVETLLPYVEGKRKPVDSDGKDENSIVVIETYEQYIARLKKSDG